MGIGAAIGIGALGSAAAIGTTAAVVGIGSTIANSVIGSNAAGDAAAAQTQAANNATQTQLQMYDRTRNDLSPFMTGGNNAFSQLANIFGFGGGGQQTGMTSQLGAAGSNPNAMTTIDIPGIGQIQVPVSALGGTQPQQGTTVNANNTGQPNPQLATQLLTQMPGYQFGLGQGIQALDRSAASRGLTLSGAQLKDAQAYGQGYAQQQGWQPYVSALQSAASLGENAAAGVGNAGATAAANAAQSQLQAGQSQAAGIVGSTNALTSGLSQLSNKFSSYGTPLYGSGGIVTPTNGLYNSAGSTIAANPSIF